LYCTDEDRYLFVIVIVVVVVLRAPSVWIEIDGFRK